MRTENDPVRAAIPTRVMRVLFILLFFLMSFRVNAGQYLDFTYAYYGGSVYISKYNGAGGSVTIPEIINGLPVTSIGGWAFAGSTNLTSVTIPNHVTYIAIFAFSGCSRLMSVTIPHGVTSIGGFAFDHCASLTSVTIPNSVTVIGDQAFSFCDHLADVTIPNSVANIGDQAFSHCASLTNVTIPDSVTSIGISAFTDCDSLTNVTIPNSVTNIGNWAFAGCDNLTAIIVDTLNPAYSSLEDVLLNKRQDTVVAYPVGKAGGYTIPNGVTAIRNYAFSGCTSLTSITIPGSVTNFGYNAFSACSNLVSVYFEGDAPSVEGKALFYNANNVIVYFHAGSKGWGTTFAGRPTQLWSPLPVYSEWARSIGLIDKYPGTSGENDDPDQDGANNLAEMYSGTDPTNPNSVLRWESFPRTNDLSEADKTALSASQHALYFQSVSGKTYTIQGQEILGDGPWQTETTVTATTTQKRVVVTKPASQRFYRVTIQP